MTGIETPSGWVRNGDAFVREFAFPSFALAGEFVAKIGRIADEVDHHPEVALRYPGIVTVHTTSHDVGTVTARDLRLVVLIEAAA